MVSLLVAVDRVCTHSVRMGRPHSGVHHEAHSPVAKEDLLASLGLMPSCGTSEQENFRVAEDWLVSELGPPDASGDSREWHYEWGSVSLAYERDGAAEAYVLWEPLHSELMTEIELRLRT